MATTLAVPAIIAAVDSNGGSGTSTINVDLRQQPDSGGFFSFEATAAAVTAGTIAVPCNITAKDTMGGGADMVIDVDFRGDNARGLNGGGVFNTRVASNAFVTGPATATIAVGSGALQTGACTVTLSQ